MHHRESAIRQTRDSGVESAYHRNNESPQLDHGNNTAKISEVVPMPCAKFQPGIRTSTLAPVEQRRVVQQLGHCNPQAQQELVEELHLLSSEAQCEVMQRLGELSPIAHDLLVRQMPQLSRNARRECVHHIDEFSPALGSQLLEDVVLLDQELLDAYWAARPAAPKDNKQLPPEDRFRDIEPVSVNGLDIKLPSMPCFLDGGADANVITFSWLQAELLNQGMREDDIDRLLCIKTHKLIRRITRCLRKTGIQKPFRTIGFLRGLNCKSRTPLIAEIELRFYIQDKDCYGKQFFAIPGKSCRGRFSVVENMDYEAIISDETIRRLGLRERRIRAFRPEVPTIHDEDQQNLQKHNVEKKEQSKIKKAIEAQQRREQASSSQTRPGTQPSDKTQSP